MKKSIICGVYKITNTLNKKSYIGSSHNINKRWREHTNDLKNNKHHNLYLQKSWNKYSSAAFEFEILQVTNFEDLLVREQYWIDTLKPEYNLGVVGGGDNISKHPNNYELRIKNSIAQKLRFSKYTPEQMEELRQKYKGEKSVRWKGGSKRFKCKCGTTISRYATECNRCHQLGEKNSFWGRHHTEEHKAYMRKVNSGKRPANAKYIIIDNVKYDSLRKAAKALNVAPSTISNWVRIGRYTVIDPKSNGPA